MSENKYKDSDYDKNIIAQGWGIIGNGTVKDIEKLRKKAEKKNPDKIYTIFPKAYNVYGELIPNEISLWIKVK